MQVLFPIAVSLLLEGNFILLILTFTRGSARMFVWCGEADELV
jgi:hypothetical protein